MAIKLATIILMVTLSLMGLCVVAYMVMDIIEKIREWRRKRW